MCRRQRLSFQRVFYTKYFLLLAVEKNDQIRQLVYSLCKAITRQPAAASSLDYYQAIEWFVLFPMVYDVIMFREVDLDVQKGETDVRSRHYSGVWGRKG